MDAHSAPAWRWFAAWAVVGGLYALSLVSMLTIGLFVLPIPLLATFLLVRHQAARHGMLGWVAGVSVPLFYVALLNRQGPGMICSAIEGGTACTQEMSPWPWSAAGLAFLAAGTSAFWLHRSRSAAAGPQVNEVREG
ncbi:MAG: hypothetical protein ABI903_17020 [Actinomycetota bacterium]